MHVLAVVPIVMSAGAAALPTIIAALGSIIAILFKPRELLGLCRRRPVAAGVAVLVLVISVWVAIWWARLPAAAQLARGPRQAGRVDWAKVAEDLITQEAAGKVPTVPGAGSVVVGTGAAVPSSGDGTEATHGVVDDYSRAFFDGGASPVGLKALWRYRPEGTMFLSMPAVLGKRIYVAGCQSDLGGYTGVLACLDAETGKPMWEVTALGDEVLRPFFSSPVITADGKYLVIGQGLHEDHDCSLLCFETATGKLHWAAKTTLHIESSPAVFGDVAVVGAGAIEAKDGKPTGDPGYVFGVRISDGKELWRQAVNDPESTPAIDENGVVYIGSGFNGNAVVAIRSESEEELKAKKLERVVWRKAVGQPVTGTMTFAGDMVITGAGNGDFVHSNANSQGLVTALDRKTGEVRWQTTVRDTVLGSIAFRDGMVICPSRTGEVMALAVKDGSVTWRQRISGDAPLLAGCAFTGTRVYAVSSDGYLAVLDAKDGKVLEKISLNDQGKPGSGLTGCPPRVVGGRVIVGSETGGVACLVGSGGAQ